MTKTNFTFSTLAEAKEAWETLHKMVELAGHLDQTFEPKEWLTAMDRIVSNVKEDNGPI